MKLTSKHSWIRLLSVFSILIISALSAQELVWHEWEDHWYAKTSITGSWAECRAEAQYYGGDLVSLNNQIEEAFIWASFGFEPFWIGLSDDDEKDGWTTGEPLVYHHWTPLPFANGCAVMNLPGLFWSKVPCDQVFPSIIETNVDPTMKDSDGDGVMDEEDTCPDSDNRATIILGDHDTGIDNFMLEDGCYVSDMLYYIVAESKNLGQRIYNVVQFTNELIADGLLTVNQRARIINGLTGRATQ